MKKIITLLTLGNILWTAPAAAGFFSQSRQGWHWYETTTLPLTANTKNIAKKSTPPEISSQEISAVKQLKAVKAQLQESLAKAWLNPTVANVKAYQYLQKQMLDQAEQFSHSWVQAVFTTPALDHTLISPPLQKARHLYNDLQSKKLHHTIKALAKEYGLFFIFSSACDYCHGFAPIVQQFADTYHWQVLPISVDGKGCKEFPHPVTDNGLLQQWHVQHLPALFAVNPNTGHVIPIAYGMISIQEIEQRIASIQHKPIAGK